MKRYAVIAGSYRQFEDWKREQRNPKINAVFVYEPRHCYGVEFYGYELYGTWYKQRNVNELVTLVQSRIR